MLGEACAEAPGVAWHDAGRSVARTAGVVPRALESGVSYFSGFSSPSPQVCRMSWAPSALPPLTDLKLKNKFFSGQRRNWHCIYSMLFFTLNMI